MGKKPHISFPWRKLLDGTEELYTQNAAYDPAEQKFTLAQVKDWILKNKPAQIVASFEATENDQKVFTLKNEVLLPELSEVHFEKCKLTYGQDYRILGKEFYFLGKGFQICPGEQLEIKYYTSNQNQ